MLKHTVLIALVLCTFPACKKAVLPSYIAPPQPAVIPAENIWSSASADPAFYRLPDGETEICGKFAQIGEVYWFTTRSGDIKVAFIQGTLHQGNVALDDLNNADRYQLKVGSWTAFTFQNDTLTQKTRCDYKTKMCPMTPRSFKHLAYNHEDWRQGEIHLITTTLTECGGGTVDHSCCKQKD